MNPLCEELRQARGKFIETIDSVPEAKRNEIFLGKWDLKDILSHLTGWASHQIEVLRALRNGTLPERHESVKDFNDESVKSRREKSWSEVYDEFIGIGERLLAEYKALASALWKRNIWKDKELTPEGFIRIEIKHYQETHLPQIKDWLCTN